MKIGICAGHGGKDPGAVYGGLIEKNLNLKVALKLKELLKLADIDYFMVRESDVFISLNDMTNILNKQKLDLIVDIHHNAGKGDGYDLFYSIYGNEGANFSKLLAVEFEKNGQNKHYIGVKKASDGRDYFYMIRGTVAPCIIGEYAFLDNDRDNDIVDSEGDLINEARAYAKAICKFAGKAFVDFNTSEKNDSSNNSSDDLYFVQVGAFTNKDNATKLANDLKAKGFKSYIKK
ncbi:MAG: N-acetylmuramoyl-L-alanine amidase [Clostridiaceae bacterium]